jgi:hypothetical protein
MSPAIALLVEGINSNTDFAKMTLADFTDADMFIRPSPHSWHVMYQMGHCINGEAYLMSKLDPGIEQLPAEFSAMFGPDRAVGTDPAAFPTKAKLLEMLDWQRIRTVAAVSKLTEADLLRPSPLPDWAPTMGQLLLLISGHMTMHLGQVQVARRVLGKRVLF